MGLKEGKTLLTYLYRRSAFLKRYYSTCWDSFLLQRSSMDGSGSNSIVAYVIPREARRVGSPIVLFGRIGLTCSEDIVTTVLLVV